MCQTCLSKACLLLWTLVNVVCGFHRPTSGRILTHPAGWRTEMQAAAWPPTVCHGCWCSCGRQSQTWWIESEVLRGICCLYWGLCVCALTGSLLLLAFSVIRFVCFTVSKTAVIISSLGLTANYSIVVVRLLPLPAYSVKPVTVRHRVEFCVTLQQVKESRSNLLLSVGSWSLGLV